MGTLSFCILSFLVFETSAQTAQWQYGVLIDAGSSGSKLKVYRWPKRLSTSEVLNLELISNNKFKPGISDLATDALIQSHLKSIINEAKSLVPPEVHKVTPIFLMATAGLRVLPESQTTELMTSVRSYLSNLTNNPFIFSQQGARILSGEEEAVYGWISINYLKKYFGSNKAPSQAFGILEMGGGSTQISFLPDGRLLADMFPVRIADVKYNLYAHSYLYYGQDFISLRINRYLYRQNRTVTTINNPCMLKGDDSSYKDEDTMMNVPVVGAGDPSQCLELLQYFLKSANDYWCYPKPCAIGRTYQPPVRTDMFYAVAAFVYAPSIHAALDEFGRLRIDYLNDTAFTYCQKNFSQAVIEVDAPSLFLSSYCLLGLYIPELLTSAYGFPRNTTNIYVADKIDDQKIDWAMGAMLYEIENMDNININDCTTTDISGSSAVTTNTLTISLLFFVISIFCSSL